MVQRSGNLWKVQPNASVSLKLPEVALEITRGRARQRIRPVQSAAFLIGSAPDCDLVLGEPGFAAVHSYLLLRPTRVAIRHLGFEPKLIVSGQEIAWAALQSDDCVRIGSYEFRIRVRWHEAPDAISQLSLFVDPQRDDGTPEIGRGELPRHTPAG